MAKGGRKSALTELIRSGLVADGELLRYKSKQGQLMAVGRAREAGIEVEGHDKLLGYTAFEAVAKSTYHRPAEHTHTSSSRTLQGLQLQAAGVDGGGGGGGGGGGRFSRHAAPEPEPEPAVELLEDENDDLCHICGLGGDLMCCETCPAVYHAACVGMEAAPEGDFYCPLCRCTVCDAGGSEGIVPTGCQWLSCEQFVGPDALQQGSRPHIGMVAAAGAGGAAGEAAAAAPPKPEPSAAGAESGAEPMQIDGAPSAAAAEGVADFSRFIAAAQAADVFLGTVPAEAAEAAAGMRAAAEAAPDAAAVHCPVTGRWTHLRCFPPQFAQHLRSLQPQMPCISSALATAASRGLAAACAVGVVQLGSIAEGSRPGGPAGGEGGGGGAPLPLSLLVVRGAAVASPSDCRGHAPAYTPEQRQQLRLALSAALHVLHSCFDSLPDSRTGEDMIPWLLRGAVIAGGEVDFSGMHTALLYAGGAAVAAAVFRSFGEVAELPLLAVRPELQKRNGLGRLLLAGVEQLLAAAGAKVLLMPGFTEAGQPYLPVPPAPEGLPEQAPPVLLQARWGYSLAPPQQMVASTVHPLVRLPGVLFACKPLAEGEGWKVLPAPRLPQRLQWSGSTALDLRQMVRDGLLVSVASAAPAAAAAAASRAAGGAGRGRAAAPQPPARPRREAAYVKEEEEDEDDDEEEAYSRPRAVGPSALLALYHQQLKLQSAVQLAVAQQFQQQPQQQVQQPLPQQHEAPPLAAVDAGAQPLTLGAYQQMLQQQQQQLMQNPAYALQLLQQQQAQQQLYAAMLATQQQLTAGQQAQQQQPEQQGQEQQGQQEEQQEQPVAGAPQ